MRTRLFIVVVGLSTLVAAAPVWAHHAMIVHFDLDKPITLRGTLTKMEWVNPHGSIYMDVTRPDGQVEKWAIETGSPYQMMKRGLSPTDFQPGIEIIVFGFAAKGGKRALGGWMVTFPNREASWETSFALGR